MTVLQAQIPDAPVNLANDPATTAADQIAFTWEDGAFDGASSIVDYKVFKYEGAGPWTELATGVTTKSFIALSMTADTLYTFKVQARNAVGYSADSPTVSIRAASLPGTPSAPTTTVNGDNVDIAWDVSGTDSDGGSPITAYTILIRHTDGVTFSEDTANCDASQSAIRDAKTCSVPISVLRASPFSNDWGSSIYVKLTATNTVGTSPESAEGNGATILTFPDEPTGLVNLPAVTTAS